MLAPGRHRVLRYLKQKLVHPIAASPVVEYLTDEDWSVLVNLLRTRSRVEKLREFYGSSRCSRILNGIEAVRIPRVRGVTRYCINDFCYQWTVVLI